MWLYTRACSISSLVRQETHLNLYNTVWSPALLYAGEYSLDFGEIETVS